MHLLSKERSFALTAGLLVVLLACGRAEAYAITVFEPDNFAVGTNLTNAVDGVTVSYLYQDLSTPETYGSPYAPGRRDVFAISCPAGQDFCPASEGSVALGSVWYADNFWRCSENPGSGCGEGYQVMEFLFDSPTDLAQATMTARYGSPMLFAYDSFGTLLYYTFGHETIHGDPETTNTYVLGVNRSEADVARIVLGVYNDGGTINQVLFARNVPEPGTLGLICLGLLGMSIARRRSVSWRSDLALRRAGSRA